MSLPYLLPGWWGCHILPVPALASGSPWPQLCQYNICSVQSATSHNKMSLLVLCLCSWSWGRYLAREPIFRAVGDFVPQSSSLRILAP